MTTGTEPSRVRVSGAVALAVTTGCSAVAGWWAMFSAPLNADEAYLLITLREWTVRGGLYDRVYSQYGPFYYALFGLPSRLTDTRWTLATGRLTSLALWVLTAALIGIATTVVTRRWVFGVAAQLLTFSLLVTLVNEPMHPGALLCFLLAALLADVAWLRPRAPRTGDVVAGALAAALVLTKVNVGLFAIVALAFTVGRGARRVGWRWITSAMLVALGPVLLLMNGQQPWRVLWSAVYVVGALAVVAAARLHQDAEAARVDVGMLAIGFGAVLLLSVGTVLATGTSVSALWRGLVVRPLDHPRLATVPVELPAAAWAWLVLIPLGVVLWRRFGASGSPPITSRWAGALRIGAGLALLVSVLGSGADILHVSGSRFALLPLAALVLVPGVGRRFAPAELLTRTLLASAAITESLHAYPVPGSQVSWSVMTGGVAAVVIVADAVSELTADTRDRAAGVLAAFVGAAVCVGLVLVLPGGVDAGITTPGSQFRSWRSAYRAGVSLDLDGTRWLRTTTYERAGILATIDLVRRECDAFVTLGASPSWYLMTDLRPPTGFNHPTWPAYLDAREQRATIAALRRSRRTCLLLNAFGGTFRSDHIVAVSHYRDRELVNYLQRRRWTQLGRGPGVLVLRAWDD